MTRIHGWSRFFGVLLAAAIGLIAGCGGPARPVADNLLVVEFTENQPLRYRLHSERQVKIELTGDKPSETRAATETMDLVMRITPVDVNPFGLTTLQFTCESADVTRTSFTGKPGSPDALESLEGQSYTVQVSPTGRLETSDAFEAMLRQVADKSFAESRNANLRVKDPDMVFDWIVFQLYLWDAVASIQNPLAGVEPNDVWTSRMLAPWPVPITNMPARLVTYKLDEIRQTPAGREAVIASDYALAQEPVTFPIPYEGRFQIRGSLFSVMHSYRHQSLEGSGTQVFNMDTGTLIEDRQQYTLTSTADFILPLGNSLPVLTINQEFSARLLNPPSGEADRAAP